MEDWTEWMPYVVPVLAILLVNLTFQLDRLRKAQDKVIHLLLHIKEVQQGIHEDAETDRWWRKQVVQSRWKWMRVLRRDD